MSKEVGSMSSTCNGVSLNWDYKSMWIYYWFGVHYLHIILIESTTKHRHIITNYYMPMGQTLWQRMDELLLKSCIYIYSFAADWFMSMAWSNIPAYVTTIAFKTKSISKLWAFFAHLSFAQATYTHSNVDWKIQSRLILIPYLSIWAASEQTIT